MKDLNGNTWDLNKAIKALYIAHREEYDGIYKIRDIADYLQGMYEREGSIEKFFLPHATEGYRQYYRALVYIA